MNKINLYYDFETNKYIINDGLHRLSILLFKNIITNTVPIKYLKLKNNNCFYFVIYEQWNKIIKTIFVKKLKTRIYELMKLVILN